MAARFSQAHRFPRLALGRLGVWRWGVGRPLSLPLGPGLGGKREVSVCVSDLVDESGPWGGNVCCGNPDCFFLVSSWPQLGLGAPRPQTAPRSSLPASPHCPLAVWPRPMTVPLWPQLPATFPLAPNSTGQDSVTTKGCVNSGRRAECHDKGSKVPISSSPRP